MIRTQTQMERIREATRAEAWTLPEAGVGEAFTRTAGAPVTGAADPGPGNIVTGASVTTPSGTLVTGGIDVIGMLVTGANVSTGKNVLGVIVSTRKDMKGASVSAGKAVAGETEIGEMQSSPGSL
jgi:hypothetical protein